MRKIVVVGVLVGAMLSAGIFIGNYASATFEQCLNDPPRGINNGKPFLEIWAAICELEGQIEDIELTPGPPGPPGPAGPGISTESYTITPTDEAGDVVIDAIEGKTFVMIFKTSSDYDGGANFQALLADETTWVNVDPSQFSDFTSVGGMDSLFFDDYKLPITIRVEVTSQANMGTSLAQIDYIQ